MICPTDGWIRISDPNELLEFLKRLTLTPKSYTEPKPLIYTGIFTETPVPCKVVGYLDKTFIVIEVNGELHSIHPEHLKDMQVGASSKLSSMNTLTDKTTGNSGDNDDDFESNVDGLLLDYVCFDIETTGVNQRFAEIIEISAIRVEDGRVAATFDQLVQPENPIPLDVADITGITNEMVADAPMIQDVMPNFLSFIRDSILIGHNIATFDLPICRRITSDICHCTLPNPYIDTLSLAHKVLKLDGYKLTQVAEALDVVPEGAHRALIDCETTRLCFESLQRMSPRSVEVRMPCVELEQPSEELELLGLKSKAKPKISQQDFTRFKSRPRAKDIVPSVQIFDPSHPLYQQTCVITGSMVHMSDGDAMQAIADAGGYCADGVTKKVNILIVGGASNPEKKSGKLKKAEEYIAKGQDLRILSEDEFLTLLHQESEPTSASISETVPKQSSEISASNSPVPEERLAKRLEACIHAQLDAAPEAYDLSRVKATLRSPKKGDPYWTVVILGQTCFRFKGVRKKYVEAAPIISRILSNAELNLENRTNEDDWPRTSAKGLTYWLEQTTNHTVFVDIYEKLLQANGFDCCSQYMQCSEAGYCIHPDIMFAGQCTYRQKLKNGIIFFGERHNM